MDTRGRLEEIAVYKIKPGDRARKTYKNIDKLWESIQEKGLIHPIAVRAQEDGTYYLLAGGRRFMACVFGEVKTIMCHVYFGEMTPLDMREIELMENIEREDLEYTEEVALKKEIHDLRVERDGQALGPSEGHSIADTAALLGESTTLVSEDIRLATAIQSDPSLAKQKNKSAAKRLLKRKIREQASQLALETHKMEIAKGIGDQVKAALVDCYMVGDCFEHMKQIPDNSINFCEVDPPYAIDIVKVRRNEMDRGGLEEYNEILASEYEEFLTNITRECYRILVDGGWMVFWFAIHPWYPLVLLKIQEAGFDIFGLPALWYKEGSAGQTNNPEVRLGSAYEPFFYARKGQGVLYRPGTSNVFEYRTIHHNHKIHPTERPLPLIEDIITLFSPPSGNVVVPFLGSGNSLLACSNTGRKGIGFDNVQQYKALYSTRVLEGKVAEYRVGG